MEVLKTNRCRHPEAVAVPDISVEELRDEVKKEYAELYVLTISH